MGRFVMDYASMMQDAMRNMVVCALRNYQKGRIKDANFLLVVNIKHKNVVVPEEFKRPRQRILALLLQGDNPTMNVGDDYFSITYPGNLVVPLDAIISFYDKGAEVEIMFDDDFEDEVKKEYEKHRKSDKKAKSDARHRTGKSDLNNLINFSDIIEEK
ncbi:MAG: ClpXP protease specificity-enhancing factor SspB [Rickettsiales bacterium]|jgi:hypothetical protein|nr:ClpXP protease specificity-enhancing factor SspB [Rickettsiales bacterium]